jgi:CubicO group peptidase (beta-lactamase class C family)
MMAIVAVAPTDRFAAEAANAPAVAVAIDRTRLDRALADMVATNRAAGVSTLVWQNGREVYFGAAGFADREAKKPMRRDTLVQIFSMTKPVTGVALMQLWEHGRFGLDDPLSRYLPEFEDVQVWFGQDAAGKPIYQPPLRPILIRDVLRHTAGFAYGGDDTPPGKAWGAEDPLAFGNDLAGFGRRLAKVPLLYDPGTQWRYSAAVDVQALLVEKLSGEPFETYVRRHIFEPLKMNETGWAQPEERFGRLAISYAFDKEKKSLTRMPDPAMRVINFNPDRKLVPGGFGLASTLDDYMRFARMLLGGGELDGARILKPSTVRLMATDQLDPRVKERHFLPGKGNGGFGFNFFVRTGRPKSPEEARGAVGEYFWDGARSTLFWVDPANDMAVVFFAQTDPIEVSLHRDIRAAVYGADYLGPPGD